MLAEVAILMLACTVTAFAVVACLRSSLHISISFDGQTRENAGDRDDDDGEYAQYWASGEWNERG